MNTATWIMVALATIGCLLTAGGLIATVTKLISASELSIVNKVNEIKTSIHKEFYEENDKLRHELAETLKPIQTHIALYEEKHYKLELYIRDNYIEVSTFQNALDEIKELIKDGVRKIDKISEDSINWRRGRKDQND